MSTASGPSGKVARRPKCLHCHDRPSQNDRRGLCYPCWDDRSIREAVDENGLPLYPAHARAGEDAVGDLPAGVEPLPALEPTYARPGTSAKKAVLRTRAVALRCLKHPGDGEFVSAEAKKAFEARMQFAARFNIVIDEEAVHV